MSVMEYQIPANVAAIQRTIKRKPTVAGAVANISAYVDNKLGEAASNLSRGAIIKARLTIVNEAMMGLIQLLYELDESGHPVNVEPTTGRVLVPVPWGSSGWAKWKLKQHEGRTLRKVLDRRMRASERVAMFLYSGASGRWHINRRYGTPEQAKVYFRQQPITVKEWRLCLI